MIIGSDNITIEKGNYKVQVSASGVTFSRSSKTTLNIGNDNIKFYKSGTTTACATISSTGFELTSGKITLGSNIVIKSDGDITALKGIIGPFKIGVG